MSSNLVVRFAGEGGQGVVTAAEGLAQAAARVGYHVQTFSTFPSQIKGGPTWAQTRVSTEPVLAAGDELDVLVVLNRYAYDHNLEELRDGGVVVYNSGDFDVDGDARCIGMDVDVLARETGNPLAANMVMIGAVAALADMPEDYFTDFIRERFTRGRANDDAIIEANVKALRLGMEAVKATGRTVTGLEPPPEVDGARVLMRGYEAACLGAIAGGLDVFIGYPISPATTMLTFMETYLSGPDTFVGQSSSEIESVTALIGAGFGGKRAMTSTAGPGLSLMSEGLGLAWMAEIPLVVANVQRGGPSTGLPTKTEQSDLLTSLNPGHGDLRIPIIAPGSVEECFYAASHAINWAERYQGPVILLSEASLAERQQDVPRPALSSIRPEKRVVANGESDGDGPPRRYSGEEVTPFPVPGGPGAYVANGSEHDEYGDTTHLPKWHLQMTHRRFGKLELLAQDATYESETADASIAVLPWGGSKGPARAAYLALRDRGDLAWYYTMFLNPLPPALLEELRAKELVLVPELNYLGQLSGLLRQQGVQAESITQYSGLPFKESFLQERIHERLEARAGELARA
jgi:2-oxoglutarate ferredoxin oxidoreductase subunit alpha